MKLLTMETISWKKSAADRHTTEIWHQSEGGGGSLNPKTSSNKMTSAEHLALICNLGNCP